MRQAVQTVIRKQILTAFFAAVCMGNMGSAARGNEAGATPRERILLDDRWLFHKGDASEKAGLLYDVRPAVKDYRSDVAADAKPQDAEKADAASIQVLKPWILPTGNAFIKDPARRHMRPSAEPLGEIPYSKSNYDDAAWSKINLPHDWAIEGPFIVEGDFGGMGRLPTAGIGWYRKKVEIPASDSGKSIFLEVDGAMSYAAVWLNGHLVGGWPYGYSSWRVDLTPYVKFGGENQLAIRLDNPPASSRWYPGAGIYRNVWLVKTQPVRVAQWGTFVTTPKVSRESATIALQVVVENASKEKIEASVETEIFELDARGEKTGSAVARIKKATTTIDPAASTAVEGSVALANPKLWGPPPTQRPHRYVAVTSVASDGKVTDIYETCFGIRSVRFDANAGLFVNGEHIRVQGVNQHHDLGALGSVFNVRAAERQLEMLRELGCNAIRMSHNPPAPELLELTDRMGFLVMDEAFDVWVRKKTPLDFHLIFPDWHEQDLRAMVRRDRNSPSVILWSVGNEVGEQYTGEEGAKVAKELRDIVREEDSTRLITASANFAKPNMPFPAVFDVISLNYQGEGIRDTPMFANTDRVRTPPLYDAFHEKFPGKMIWSSETASTLSTRGAYLFPVTPDNSSPIRAGMGGDEQHHVVSAYELYAVDFGKSPDKVFAAQDQHPFVAGEFVWTGWDHLGEPTPYYSSRSSYCGIIDLAGFKKDRFFLYQARWRPELPMAHILPHWTWPERVGQVTPVHVFTSGDEAELFLNGKSLGRKKKAQYEYRLRWDDVVYEPGTLEVVAYRDGKKWATDTMKTAGAPARLEAQADRTQIAADGRDLSFVTVRIVDVNGRVAPRADNRITFSVEGPAEIVATDNGDPTSFEPFSSPQRNAFNGLCLAILRAKPGASGKVILKAASPGLDPATLEIETR